MIVTIPIRADHEGYYDNLTTIFINDYCPVCGGPRGPIVKGLSYDGSRRLVVDMWTNPCGHIDKYSDVIQACKRKLRFSFRARGDKGPPSWRHRDRKNLKL